MLTSEYIVADDTPIQYPCLRINNSDSLIVLFTQSDSGVVVYTSTGKHLLGQHIDINANSFLEFKGSVVLNTNVFD